MVATTDSMLDNSGRHATMFAPVRTVNGIRWVSRAAQRFFGTALMLAAVLMWLQSGASADQDLILFKLGVSLAMGLSGLALFRAGGRWSSTEIEIDLNAQEFRLVRRRGEGRAGRDIMERCSFDEIGTVEIEAQMARINDAEGDLLAEVPLADPQIRFEVLRAFSALGKLAA